MVAIFSRTALPELVTRVNSTLWPAESRNSSFAKRKPACVNRASAACGSYSGAGRAELNQKRFAGAAGPAGGFAKVAKPAKTMRHRSSRLIAAEIALRNCAERNQAFLYSASGAFVT